MNNDRMRKARGGIKLLALVAAIVFVPVANAQLVNVLDFQLHLSNAPNGAGLGQLTNIDSLGFQAPFQASPVTGTGLNVGDNNLVDLVGNLNDVNGGLGLTNSGAILGLDFELTFFSRLRNQVIIAAPPNFNSINTPAADTVLELYLDTTINQMSGFADANAGAGMAGPVRDPVGDPTAVLLATFQLVQPGTDGTSFSSLTNDGAADSTYQLVSDLYGVFFESDGVTPLPVLLSFAATNTNTDLDPDDNGIIDTQVPGGPFGGTCNTIFGDACGNANGDVIVKTQAVPEPGALVMLGFGLVGFAFLARRRRVRLGR